MKRIPRLDTRSWFANLKTWLGDRKLNGYHRTVAPYIRAGLVTKRKHPTLDLYLLDYTAKAQFEKKWDAVTLACRALVIDGSGKIVSRPFGKFFNWEEYKGKLPKEKPYIYPKFDGSFIQVFKYKGEVVVTSRSSFTSEHAQAARELIVRLHAKWCEEDKQPRESKWLFKALLGEETVLNSDNPWQWVCEGQTYIFELIAPWNRIVVNYGDTEDLVLTARISTKFGIEVQPWQCIEWKGTKARRVLDLETRSLEELKALNQPNEEGYVLHWPKSGLRLKIKFADYVLAHKFFTGVTEKQIWEVLMETGSVNAILQTAPDEVYDWVVEYSTELLNVHNHMVELVDELFVTHHTEDRKEFANRVKTISDPAIRAALFAKYSGYDYQKVLWKSLKPLDSKAFWNVTK